LAEIREPFIAVWIDEISIAATAKHHFKVGSPGPKARANQSLTGAIANQILETLAGDAAEAVCEKCGVSEWVIPLEGELDEIFLANYLCDRCDSSD